MSHLRRWFDQASLARAVTKLTRGTMERTKMQKVGKVSVARASKDRQGGTDMAAEKNPTVWAATYDLLRALHGRSLLCLEAMSRRRRDFFTSLDDA
jgi:hypothetical protein